jgi:hypothetical protein
LALGSRAEVIVEPYAYALFDNVGRDALCATFKAGCLRSEVSIEIFERGCPVVADWKLGPAT